MGRHSSPKQSAGIVPWVAAAAGCAVVVAGFFAMNREPDSANPAPATTVAESSVAATVTSTAQTSAATAPKSESSQSEATKASTSAPSAAAPAAMPKKDTLFLVDTSDSMAPMFPAVQTAVAEAARGIGKPVALWNYSSPLNPGVVVGYRDNLSFGSADDVAGAVAQLGTGGMPYTRSAVVAAAATASEVGGNVVVVTSGTVQDMDDATFAQQLSQDAGLYVVHVGNGEQDQALKKAADKYVTTSPDKLAQTLKSL